MRPPAADTCYQATGWPARIVVVHNSHQTFPYFRRKSFGVLVRFLRLAAGMVSISLWTYWQWLGRGYWAALIGQVGGVRSGRCGIPCPRLAPFAAQAPRAV